LLTSAAAKSGKRAMLEIIEPEGGRRPAGDEGGHPAHQEGGAPEAEEGGQQQ
jgi:hypothetical protein